MDNHHKSEHEPASKEAALVKREGLALADEQEQLAKKKGDVMQPLLEEVGLESPPTLPPLPAAAMKPAPVTVTHAPPHNRARRTSNGSLVANRWAPLLTPPNAHTGEPPQ